MKLLLVSRVFALAFPSTWPALSQSLCMATRSLVDWSANIMIKKDHCKQIRLSLEWPEPTKLKQQPLPYILQCIPIFNLFIGSYCYVYMLIGYLHSRM